MIEFPRIFKKRTAFLIFHIMITLKISQSTVVCGRGKVLHPNGTKCYDCALGYYCPDSNNFKEIIVPAGAQS